MTTSVEPASGYRELARVPGLGGIMAGIYLSRTATAMMATALTLLALDRYDSATIGGAAVFAAMLPGLVVSPLAGALLDRHGRVRLVVLDYCVAAATMGVVAALAVADVLAPWMLIGLAGTASLTTPFSTSGLRSLIPLVVPERLWSRANALDSGGYVVGTMVGPLLAGVTAQIVGARWAVAGVSILFLLSAATVAWVPDPVNDVATTGSLRRDTLHGLAYVWRNPTLRALGVVMSLTNVGWGSLSVLIPVIITRRLELPEGYVGVAFGAMSVGGVVAAVLAGRLDVAGHERRWLLTTILGMSAATALLAPDLGLVGVVVGLAAYGLVNGPLDIALFTVRQRRTDPAWMGRAFAISMAINALGMPVGAALAGWLADRDVALAVVVATATTVVGGLLVPLLMPPDEQAGARMRR